MACSKLRFPGDSVLYIGDVRKTFLLKKLPTTREVLQVLFYQIRVRGKGVKESAWHVVSELTPFYSEYSRIPIIAPDKIFQKIWNFYKEWDRVKINHKRQSDSQKKRESEFTKKLDLLFDITLKDVLNLIENEEDKKFLEAQRLPDRRGNISVHRDFKLAAQENEAETKRKRAEERAENQKRYKREYEARNNSHGASQLDVEQFSPEEGSDTEKKTSHRRGRKNILTPLLTTTYESAGLSARDSAVVLARTAHAFGHDAADYNINFRSIQRKRIENRSAAAATIKAKFVPDERLTLHWDGKIVPDLNDKKKVDRYTVSVTGVTTSQMLGAPKIEHGTALEIAKAVFELVKDWNLGPNIRAFSFDTPSVNTGLIGGAAALLKEHLQCDHVLHLACRHHIKELVLEAVFELNLKSSGGPDICLFKRFQLAWDNIDPAEFTTGAADESFLSALGGDGIDSVIEFATDQLKIFQPRADYRELLNLAIIVVGGVPPKGIKFYAPGAFNKTRWMVKAIYALKIYMFQGQFTLTKYEKKGVFVIVVFVLKVYLKAWFRAANATGAPKNDLELIQSLKEFRSFNDATATVGLRKISGHLWYVSETLVPLALFDKRVSDKIKRACVKNLKSKPGLPNPPLRLPIYAEECSELQELFTTNSKIFFEVLDLPQNFLNKDPKFWSNNKEYQQARVIVKSLKVVNDVAERAVQLMQHCNDKKLTKQEEGFQNLLQVTSEVKKTFNKSKKITANVLKDINI